MATLQKFKMFATQCTVAGSPTRSPTASPVIHLRRRKTLRMLLYRGGGRRLPPLRNDGSPDSRGSSDEEISQENGKQLSVSHKLKDLFVSSPPAFGDRVTEDVREGFLPTSSAGVGGGFRRVGPRSLRPLAATIRQRLLRKAWRPLLVAIPE